MAYGNWRYVNDKTTGRFVLSGGHYPAENMSAHQNLPSLDTMLGTTHPDDPRIETVITMGTVVTVVKDTQGTGNANATNEGRLVPANGYRQSATTSDVTYNDGNGNSVTVTAEQAPVGVAAQHIRRPFHVEHDTEAGMWVAGSALVEWPMVTGGGLDGASVGDLVTFDESGRPIVAGNTNGGLSSIAAHNVIGRVVETEVIGTNFDQGLLNFMQFSPSEPVVEHVYRIQASGDHQDFIARANLDTADVQGAARVLLNI